MTRRAPAKQVEPAKDLHEISVVWQVQKTIQASSLEEFREMRDAVTAELQEQFDEVSVQGEGEDGTDTDDYEDDDFDEDDEARDLADPPDGELDFDT